MPCIALLRCLWAICLRRREWLAVNAASDIFGLLAQIQRFVIRRVFARQLLDLLEVRALAVRAGVLQVEAFGVHARIGLGPIGGPDVIEEIIACAVAKPAHTRLLVVVP